MSILTQDTARMFLANSSPTDKYNFFLKGTSLERLSADYKLIREYISNTSAMLKAKKSALPDMVDDVARLRKKWNDMEKAQRVEQEITEMNAQLVWAKIKQVEKKIEFESARVSTFQKKIDKATPEVQQYTLKLKDLEHAESKFKQEFAQIRMETGPITDKSQKAHAKLREMRTDNVRFDEQLQEIQTQVQFHSRNKEDLLKRIAAEEQRLKTDQVAVRQQKASEIKLLQAQKQNREESRSELLKKRDALTTKGNELYESTRQAEPKLRDLQSQISQSRGKIQQMLNQQQNRIRAFGENMPDLVRRIDELHKQRRWEGFKPIGPIGLHVKLNNHGQNYEQLIDSLLGATLDGMIVETTRDQDMLQQLARQCKIRNLNVFKVNRSRLDYSNGEPSRQFLTTLRAIEVDEPIALSTLIINHRIEQQVIVETRSEGDRITDPKNGGFPQNVSNVFSKDGFSVGSRGGGLASRPIFMRRGTPRLSSQLDRYIAEERQHETKICQEYKGLEAMFQEMKREEENTHRDIHNLRMLIAKVEGELNTIDSHIEDIRQVLNALDETNIQSLEDALRQEESKIDLYAKQQNSMREQLKRNQEDISKLGEHSAELNRALDELSNRKSMCERELDTIQTQKGMLLTNLKHYQESVAKNTADKKKVEEEVAEMKQRFQARLAEVEMNYGQRIEVDKTPEEIQRRLTELHATLKQKEKEHGSREKVWNELDTKQKQLEEASHEVRSASKVMKELNMSLKTRLYSYEEFKKYISIRSMRIFASLIKKRGFEGQLTLDHKNHELFIKVKVNPQESNSRAADEPKVQKNEDPRGLSGGEKSYATVCLLLSLWESMASPFRALDEFDVFMDAVNRRLAMKLMVDNARDTDTHSQYILITPQNMSNVPGIGGRDIRVSRLGDPERGQTRLNFPNASQRT